MTSCCMSRTRPNRVLMRALKSRCCDVEAHEFPHCGGIESWFHRSYVKLEDQSKPFC